MKKAVYCTSNFTAFVNIEVGGKKERVKEKKKKREDTSLPIPRVRVGEVTLSVAG